MKKLYFYIILSLCLFMFSCGNRTSSDKESKDTLWNNKVQNTFYDMNLGDSISADSIIENLTSRNFTYYESPEERLCFTNYDGKVFSFGGFYWQNLTIYRLNGKFQMIDFTVSYTDETEALCNYRIIKRSIKRKYKLFNDSIKDQTQLAICTFWGKNNIAGCLTCFYGQVRNGSFRYIISLAYNDLNNTVSNDL